MTETWYPAAVQRPIATGEYYRNRAVPTISIVEHITAGTDSRDWLQYADNGSSVHFLIRVENGRAVVYQFMPIEWAAWGNGRFSRNNPHMPQWIKDIIKQGPTDRIISNKILGATISIEHEGKTPTAALYTGPMLEASIELNKWLAATVPTIKRDRDHIIGHYQIDHVNRPFCPGGTGGGLFPFDKVLNAMTGAPIEKRVMNGFEVSGAFLRYWDTKGGLEIFGLPIEGVVPGQVGDWQGPIQWFERARFEDHDGIVLLGRVGVEAKAAIP